MTNKYLAKLWTAVAVATLYLTLNAWLATQGALFRFPGLTFEDYKAGSASLWGLGLAGSTFLLLHWLWRHHLSLVEEKSWWQRIPRLGEMDYDPSTPLGRKVQVFSLVCFLILPTLGQVHFLHKLYKSSVVERANSETFATGFQHYTKPVSITVLWKDRFRVEEENGITFFPFWEPWLFLLTVLAILFGTGRLLQQIFWPKIKEPDQAVEKSPPKPVSGPKKPSPESPDH